MHLSKLIIVNYRSCKKVQIEFENNESNILIGINDSGKSSILKAAELLFIDKPVFSFIKDNSAKMICQIQHYQMRNFKSLSKKTFCQISHMMVDNAWLLEN